MHYTKMQFSVCATLNCTALNKLLRNTSLLFSGRNQSPLGLAWHQSPCGGLPATAKENWDHTNRHGPAKDPVGPTKSYCQYLRSAQGPFTKN